MNVYVLKPGGNRTMLMGEVRKVGERVMVADEKALSPTDQQMLAEHFVLVEQQEKKAGQVMLRNGLSEDQARHKLRSSGVVHADSVPVEELADLFDQVFSGHLSPDKEASAKQEVPQTLNELVDVPNKEASAKQEVPQTLNELVDVPSEKKGKKR